MAKDREGLENDFGTGFLFFLQQYSGTPLNRTPLGPEEMSGLQGCPMFYLTFGL